MKISEEGKKYRKKYAGSIAVAILIGGFIGGLTGLIAWMALAKKSPRPTALVLIIYTAAGLCVIAAAATRLRGEIKKERETEKSK